MLIILALDFASPYKYNEGKKDIIPFLPYKWTRHKIIDLKILHTLFDMRIHLSKSRTWEMFQNFWKINCHKKSSLMNVKTTITVSLDLTLMLLFYLKFWFKKILFFIQAFKHVKLFKSNFQIYSTIPTSAFKRPV